MSDVIHGADALHLFEACGFRDEGMNALSKTVRFKTGARRSELFFTLQDAWEWSVPRDGTARYRVVAALLEGNDPNRKDVAFTSANAADILAFVVSMEKVLKMDHGDEIPASDVFELSGAEIRNAFADEESGKGRLMMRPKERDGSVYFAHPAEAYGEAYCRWRDGLVEAVLRPRENGTDDLPTPGSA